MSEKKKFLLACEKELERLKQEEAFIQELLRDVQKQLGRFKVEALHMSHVNLLEDDDTDEEKLEEDDLLGDNLLSAEMLDAADVVNQNKLNLELVNEAGDEELDESDEFELSD